MPSTATASDYLTTAEVQEILRVGEHVVYDRIKNAGLPAHRMGRRWLFDRAEVDAWVRSQRLTSDTDDTASPTADPDWVAAQVAKFTPDDLRRAGELLLALSNGLATAGGAR